MLIASLYSTILAANGRHYSGITTFRTNYIVSS